ncbi:non-specific serine/threonine protein kinase [Gammaproteobacteria bacterium]
MADSVSDEWSDEMTEGGAVTQRWQAEVTARLPSQAVTERFTTSTTIRRRTSPGLETGLMIGERYRILEGPIGHTSGEAEVYRCRDEDSGEDVAVKLYRPGLMPHQAVIEGLAGLVHPHVVTLRDFGEFAGRFYEVSEFCAGGTLADRVPLDESALIAFLPALIAGLEHCHRQGIVHRDIKPANLFFRDADSAEILLGDFGISSHLELGTAERATQTAAHLTLDYGAPELLDRHQVGPPTDYYALGICLIHARMGHSPFQGLTPNDILVAHLRGRIPLPDASPRFLKLLQGLTLIDPRQRWGYRDLRRWLEGAEIPLPTAPPPVAEGHPYPGFPAATTPRALAGCLDRFDALVQLQRGDIRRWIFDHFGADLAERIAALEGEASRQPRATLMRLGYLLDPQGPLKIGDWQVQNLGELARLLHQEDPDTQQALETVSWNGGLAMWIEAGARAGERTPELLQRLVALCDRLAGSRGSRLVNFALGYLLDPARPFALIPELVIQRPDALCAHLPERAEAIAEALTLRLLSGHWEAWLWEARPPGWEDAVAFAETIHYRYQEEPALAGWCLVWRLCPDWPLIFQSTPITDPRQLVRLIDRSSLATTEGLQLLQEGRLRAWLVGAVRLPSVNLDSILLTLNLPWRAKLEALLQAMDPTLPLPLPDVQPERIHFGPVKIDRPRSAPITVRNRGRGFLYGSAQLQTPGYGLFLEGPPIQGGETRLTLRLNAQGLEPGHYENRLLISTNGGERTVSIQFQISERSLPSSGWRELLGAFLERFF